MNKETFYFSHDYNARVDQKIKKLLLKLGMEGYGVYWSIIEDLYQNANALQLDTESIAYDLRTNENIVSSVIHDFELFVIDGNYFGSLSVEKRLNLRLEKSKKATEAANLRWSKYNNNNELMQTHSGCNTDAMQTVCYKSKGKESKVNENKFVIPTILEIKNYCLEIKNNVDAEKFFNFYESKGWMVGKNKMKDWKACIRTWESKETHQYSNLKPQDSRINHLESLHNAVIERDKQRNENI